jgi:hypothetical protein
VKRLLPIKGLEWSENGLSKSQSAAINARPSKVLCFKYGGYLKMGHFPTNPFNRCKKGL